LVTAWRVLLDAGVEPYLCMLEGIGTESDSRRVAAQARAGGRDRVGVIVLGRGENAEKVKHWLSTAARVPGLIGFAVGRTIFWEPLKGVREGRLTREQASGQIAANYKAFCDLWEKARHKGGPHPLVEGRVIL
jgi:5-dehydro-2-deoxygluconokinase